MVYCGKPSKSCRQCRNRNIKCDKKEPSCGQCLRATLTCPGYPNPNNVVIRDETSLTIHRVVHQHVSHAQAPIISPKIHLIDRAKCLFVTTHVFGTQSSFYYMKEFFPPSLSDDFLINTVQAVCLAYLANDSGRPDIMRKARLKYSEGLVAMGKALGRKSQATRKEVLASVLLMDCFERLSQDDASSAEIIDERKTTGDAEVEAGYRHLTGAVALCKLRGPSQFDDPLNVAMFHQMSFNILFSCVQRGSTIPADYLQVRAEAAAVIPPTDAKWRAENLLLDFLDFRTRLQPLNVSTDEISASVQRLEKEYKELCKIFHRAKYELAVVSMIPGCESPTQRRNNLNTIREIMDIMFSSLQEIAPWHQTPNVVDESRFGEVVIPI